MQLVRQTNISKLILLFYLVFWNLTNNILAQNWEEMATFTSQIKSRTDKTQLLFNDSIEVELRDFGIHEFTIFKKYSKHKNYLFIYHCNCKENKTLYSGGKILNDNNFYQSVYIKKNDFTWNIEPFVTNIALSFPFSEMKKLRLKNKCIMTDKKLLKANKKKQNRHAIN
jgi:hypothetical protein